MPAFISPLDAEYITLKRAALLIAREQPGIEPSELLEMFKHALFNGEFERTEADMAGIDPGDERNLPLLRIEAPPTGGHRHHLRPEHQPQEYLAVRAATVAELLSERNALPGDECTWSTFTSFPRGAGTERETLRDLARIPYSAFPAAAQDIFGNIVLAKAKLRSWMAFKGHELPSFLAAGEQAQPKRSDTKPAEAQAPKDDADTARGRPRKAGWSRIEQLIRELHATRSGAKRSVLAFDARKLATREFDEKNLPSVETITRKMKTILATEA